MATSPFFPVTDVAGSDDGRSHYWWFVMAVVEVGVEVDQNDVPNRAV
jgi:hypothetical protein